MPLGDLHDGMTKRNASTDLVALKGSSRSTRSGAARRHPRIGLKPRLAPAAAFRFRIPGP
ncbi:protein of unknown function [Aminobacter niigataensis]|nr:protein of unknown function [Aminobacter niigataensis]